jgi:hypothetical protein
MYRQPTIKASTPVPNSKKKKTSATRRGAQSAGTYRETPSPSVVFSAVPPVSSVGCRLKSTNGSAEAAEKRRARIARDEERRNAKVSELTPIKESALLAQSVDNSVAMSIEGNRPNYLLVTDSVGKDFSMASNSLTFRGRWEQAREVMHSATSVENDFFSGFYFLEGVACNLFQVTIQNLTIRYGTSKGCLSDSFLASVHEFFGLPESFSFSAVFVLAGKEDVTRVCDPVYRAQLDAVFPELAVNNLPSYTFSSFHHALWEGLTALQRNFDCPLFYLGMGPMGNANPPVEPVWVESLGRQRVDSYSAEELHYYCSRGFAAQFLCSGDLPRVNVPIFCPLPRYSDIIFRGGSTLQPRAVLMIMRDVYNCFVRGVNLLRHLRPRLSFACCIGKPKMKLPDDLICPAVTPSVNHNHGDQPCVYSTSFNGYFSQDIANHLTLQVHSYSYSILCCSLLSSFVLLNSH